MNERIDIQLEFKDRVISKVLLATNNSIDSRAMWTEWNILVKYEIGIEGWQRIVTKIIEAYQTNSLERLKRGERPMLIWSGGKGYYAVEPTKENISKSVAGLIFYNKKLMAGFPRRKIFKEIIKYAHETNIDRHEQPGQVNLFN